MRRTTLPDVLPTPGAVYWLDAAGCWLTHHDEGTAMPVPASELDVGPDWWRTAVVRMPGMVNGHTHPLQSLLRFGRRHQPAEGFGSWLHDLVRPFQNAATPALFGTATTSCLADNLIAGVTRVDLHCKGIRDLVDVTAIASAAGASGLRVTLHVGLYPDQLSDQAWLNDLVDTCRDVQLQHRTAALRADTASEVSTDVVSEYSADTEPGVGPALGVGIGPVNLHDADDAGLDVLTGIVHETGWPLHTHVSETPETAGSLDRLTRRRGPLTGWQLVHCVHEPESRLREAVERGADIVYCHRSNLLLGVGLPGAGIITQHFAPGSRAGSASGRASRGWFRFGSDGSSSSGTQSVAQSAYTGWLAYGSEPTTPRPGLADMFSVCTDQSDQSDCNVGDVEGDTTAWRIVAPVGHPASLLSEFMANPTAFHMMEATIAGRQVMPDSPLVEQVPVPTSVFQ